MQHTAEHFIEELYEDGVFVRDDKMLQLYQQAKDIGLTGANILISGESGTGKDHLAKYIHKKSKRHSKAFIHLNCSAVSDELFVSELFGYDPGAFSGALNAGKCGLAELADGGTLYLDEIGDMALQNQVKLLRFLETKTVTRLGSNQTKQIDVHIITATNKNLKESITDGSFRSDLYYRIKTIEVNLPPLRKRPKDIFALIERFEEEHGNPHKFSDEALEYLLSRPWTGNVRELQNFLEKMNILENEGLITLDLLTDGKYRFSELKESTASEKTETKVKTLKLAIAEFEKNYIIKAINETKNLTDAANLLGIDLTTLNRKKRQLGIYKRGR